MNNNIKYILSIGIALGLGLGAGYLLFNNKQANSSHEGHQHSAAATQAEEIWTCSMHPQIRQNEFGICPICEMDLTPLESNSSDNPLVLEMSESAIQLSNIQTSIIGQAGEKSSKELQLSGKIKADERLVSSQVSHISGRIEQLFISFTGEQVQKGQKIARIYSPELISAQGELLEAAKIKDINPSLLQAAKDKLKRWKIDSSTIASIIAKQQIQESFYIYADASGTVSNKRIAVGDYVQQGQALFELNQLNRLWVLFDVYEEDLAHIKLGDKISFSTASLANKTFDTRISFIDPVIDPQTRVARIRTEINNKNGLLKPEMFVKGSLASQQSTTTQALSIPKSAVMWTGKRSVAYVKLADTEIPSYEYRSIEIGQSLGDSYELISGITAGEEVVVNGSFVIDAAAQLNNQSSMMNKNVSVKKQDKGNASADYTASTPTAFKEQLTQSVFAYLDLKDMMVASNADQSMAAGQDFYNSLANIDMSLLKGEAHLFWMEQLNALQAHSKKIGESKNLEDQRKQFRFLSTALIHSVQAFGVSQQTLYVQHCPMANNDKGADWISDEEGIRNPYFGDKMMKCGFVKTTVEAAL